MSASEGESEVTFHFPMAFQFQHTMAKVVTLSEREYDVLIAQMDID